MLDLIKKGYIGNPSQIATLRRLTLAEGKARGTEIIEIKTAAGLELDFFRIPVSISGRPGLRALICPG